MTFASEADMVRSWLAREFRQSNRGGDWLVYPETAGWDLLLVHAAGYQIGIEAKLSLNAKVIDQALTGQHDWYRPNGPDYRAVLVPEGKTQLHLGRICAAIGLKVLTVCEPSERGHVYVQLPDQASNYCRWPSWCPVERCKLPDYIPDVAAGMAAPVQLTLWKVKAIKLMIVLERRGYVTRRDMQALQLSPTRWTDNWNGFLARDPRGYVASKRTPDLKGQHPTNWVQIEADADAWSKEAAISFTP